VLKQFYHLPTQVVVLSKMLAWGCFTAGIAGSNPAEGNDVRTSLFVGCCVGSGL
jgi:hypothetical protein